MGLEYTGKAEVEFPMNVMCDILSIDPIGLTKDMLNEAIQIQTPFYRKNFEEALKYITFRQKTALLGYYKYSNPINVVAEDMSSNKSSVTGLIKCALEKLSTPEVIEKLKTNENQRKILEDNKFYHFVYEIFGTLEIAYDTPIESYELSMRSYNCLKLSKLNTLSEVLRYDYETGLEHIRNLGIASLNEIKSKLYILPPQKEVPPISENHQYAGKNRLLWLADELNSRKTLSKKMLKEVSDQLRFLASVEIQLNEMFASFFISKN